jgi:mannitol/fructose-specific phosphotransferase system IIA component (Ntr-type)
MNLISSLLSPSHVALDVEANNKQALFERVGVMLDAVSGLTRAQVTDSLLARERLGSTGLGQGIPFAWPGEGAARGGRRVSAIERAHPLRCAG